MFNLFKKKAIGAPALPTKPISGGDGSSFEQAVIIDCASTGMAHMLISRFLSDKHGVEGKDWDSGFEFFAKGANGPERFVRLLSISLRDGTKREYYFDISRAMKAFETMRKQM
jgi:hypothetical protein